MARSSSSCKPSWTRGCSPSPSRRRARQAQTVGSVHEKLFSAQGQPISLRLMSCSSSLSQFWGDWPRTLTRKEAVRVRLSWEQPQHGAHEQDLSGGPDRFLPSVGQAIAAFRAGALIEKRHALRRQIVIFVRFQRKGQESQTRRFKLRRLAGNVAPAAVRMSKLSQGLQMGSVCVHDGNTSKTVVKCPLTGV